MADEQIVTNIVAKSDFSDLIADLNRVSSALLRFRRDLADSNKHLTAQIAVMNRTFAETLGDSGQFSRHFVTLTSDVETFGKQLDGGRLKLRDYFRVYQDHIRTSGGLIRDLAQQQVQLQNAIVQPLGYNAKGMAQFNVHIPRGLDTIKNKTAIARQELQIMNKVIQDGGIQLINWGKNTQWAGRQLTVGLTLPIAAFGKAAADAFKQADQELTRLTKVYGDVAGTSAQELGRVRKEVAATAKELSAAMGVNFTETIGLAADIAATGKTGNELLGSLKETTRLAVLGEVDRQEAMKATLAIQSAFKQDTDELAKSINFLNAVENQTSTTLNDLVEAIPKAGPVIKGLGGSVQDLALYLTAMREGGINASEGANALKSALASLINPTDVAVKKFEGFGIDLLGIVNKNAGNVTGTLLELQAALDRLNPLQKQQAIEQLFGKFQYSRLNALFENLGKQGSQTLKVLDLMKASAADLNAVAGRELRAVTESASGRFRRAVETLKADMAGVGDQFLDIGTKIATGLSKILDFFQKLPDPIKKLLALGGAFTAIVGPIIMLTGVLANFVGYIIKGYGHIKSFLKGGEGFKLLTPEIIAANNATKLLGDSFYSDAKAAAVLRQSINALRDSLNSLQAASSSSAVAVAPVISAAAAAAGASSGLGYRQVDVSNPFVRGRAQSHVNPRDPGSPASIFGIVPGSDLVNLKIGRTPQIYMEERLPNIEGLTSVSAQLGGRKYDVSTGIVAGEAARYHAMMATIGMQSKEEVEVLKRTIRDGGAISTDFIQTFDDILPITTRLSQNAARESAAIVSQLRAGAITVEQAKAEIIRINAQLEAGLIAETTAYATARGRVIDVTKAPLIDQPVVDPITGKPNTRAMFRQGRNLDIIEGLGRILRVRTKGAPYSIETTIPKRYNDGGSIESFGPNKTSVSGSTSITYDDRLGTIPVGGYVLNQQAAMDPANAALVAMAPYTYNSGGQITAALTPGEIIFGPGIQRDPELYAAVDAANNGYRFGGQIVPSKLGYGALSARRIVPTNILQSLFPSRFRPELNKSEYEIKGTQGVFGSSFTNATVASKLNDLLSSQGRKPIFGTTISRQKINAEMKFGPGVPPDVLLLSILSGTGSRRTSADILLQSLVRSGKLSSKKAQELSDKIFEKYAQELTKYDFINDSNNPIYKVTDSILSKEFGVVKEAWTRFASTPGMLADKSTRGSLSFLDSIRLSDGTILSFDRLRGEKGSSETFFHAGTPDPLNQILINAGYNKGGKIGGRVTRKRKNYGRSPNLLGITPFKRVLERREILNATNKDVERSIYRNDVPITLDHQMLDTGGKSFGISGIGGVYDGSRFNKNYLVHIKPYRTVEDAINDLNSQKLTSQLHGLQTPGGEIKIVNYNGSKIPVIVSKFDPEFATAGLPMDPKLFIKQLVAAGYRGDLDTSAANISGRNVNDQSTAYVYRRASGMRSMAPLDPVESIMDAILLARKGGAKKHFALSNLRNLEGLGRKGFATLIRQEISEVNNRLEASIRALPASERSKYKDLIARARQAESIDWESKYDTYLDSVRKEAAAKTKADAKAAAKLAAVQKNQGGSIAGYSRVSRYTGYRRGGPIGGGRIRRSRRNYGRLIIDPNDYSMSSSGILIPKTALAAAGDIDLMSDPLMQQIIAASQQNQTNQPSYVEQATKPRRQMLGYGISMGAGYAGGYLGGQLTGGSMMGQFLGYAAGDLAGIAIYNKIAESSGKAAASSSLMTRALSAASKLPGPAKLLAVVLAVGVAIKTINDKINEHRRIVNQGFAPTEDTVTKLNLKYKSLNQTLEIAKQKYEALEKTGRSLFRTTSQTGIPGLTLTIQELRDLKTSVEQDFPDLIDVFNKAKPDEVVAKATQLKAQFVAGGMTAQDATNLIYTLISASNDAAMAIQAINDKGFVAIKDGIDAARSSLQTFFDLVQSGNLDQIGVAFDQAFNSLMNYESGIVGTLDKNNDLITSADAFKKSLELIEGQQKNNKELTGAQLAELRKQSPVLRLILGDVSDMAGAYAKIKLYTLGIRSGLAEMNAEQAKAKALAVSTAITYLESSKGPFKDLVAAIKTQTTASKANYEAAVKSAQKIQADVEKEIKLRQKNINTIRSEADERIRALQEQQEDEDILAQIREKQLDYQAALAAGDMTAATQAQYEIQRLVSQQQKTLATRAIQDDAAERIAKEESAIEKLQARLDAADQKVQTANENATKALEKATSLQALLGQAVQAVILKIDAGERELTKYEKSIIKDTQIALEKAGFKAAAAAISLSKTTQSGLTSPPGQAPGPGDLPKETGPSGLDTTVDKVLNAVWNQKRGALAVYLVNTKKELQDIFSVGSGTYTGGTKTTYEPYSKKDGKYYKGKSEISKTEYYDASMNKPFYESSQTAYSHPLPGLRNTYFGASAYDRSKNIRELYDKNKIKGNSYIASNGWKYDIYGQVYTPDNKWAGVWYGTNGYSYASGGYLPQYSNGTDGSIYGPGTGTSDSILARLSNGEFVTKAVSVSNVGVDNMHLINTKGAQGVLEAARNLMNKATGGLIGYDKGGQPKGGMEELFFPLPKPRAPKPKSPFPNPIKDPLLDIARGVPRITTKKELLEFYKAVFPNLEKSDYPLIKMNTKGYGDSGTYNGFAGIKLGKKPIYEIATHEMLHHLDATQTNDSVKLFLKYLKKTDKDVYEQLQAQVDTRGILGFGRVDSLLNDLYKGDKITLKKIDKPLKSFWAGITEGTAQNSTYKLFKSLSDTNPELAAKIMNPYAAGKGYYDNFYQYYKFAGKTGAERQTPEFLQGILYASPDLPSATRNKWLSWIEFLKTTPFKDIKMTDINPVTGELLTAKDLKGYDKFAGGGMIPGYVLGGIPQMGNPFRGLSKFFSKLFGKSAGAEAKLTFEQLIEKTLMSTNVIPQTPNSIKQAKVLRDAYLDLLKSDLDTAATYEKSKMTVGQYNRQMDEIAQMLKDDKSAAKLKHDLDQFDAFNADSPEMEDFLKDPWKYMRSDSPEGGLPGSINEKKNPGLTERGLLSHLPAPDNVSLYDYFMFKANQTKLISDTYSNIISIAQKDMATAVKLGLIKPKTKDGKSFAFGGAIGQIPSFANNLNVQQFGLGGTPAMAGKNPFSWLLELINKSLAKTERNQMLRITPLRAPDLNKPYNYLTQLSFEELQKMYPNTDLSKVPGVSSGYNTVNIGLTEKQLFKKEAFAVENNKYLSLKPENDEEFQTIFFILNERIGTLKKELKEWEGNPQTVAQYNKNFTDGLESITGKWAEGTIYETSGVVDEKKVLDYFNSMPWITKSDVRNPSKNLFIRKFDEIKLKDGTKLLEPNISYNTGKKASSSDEMYELLNNMSSSDMRMYDYLKMQMDSYQKTLDAYRAVESLYKLKPGNYISKLGLFTDNPGTIKRPKGELPAPKNFALGGIPGYALGTGGNPFKSFGSFFSKLFKKSSKFEDTLDLKLRYPDYAKQQGLALENQINVLFNAINRGRKPENNLDLKKTLDIDPETGIPKDPYILKSMIEDFDFRAIFNPENPKRSSASGTSLVIETGRVVKNGKYVASNYSTLHEILHAVAHASGIENSAVNKFYNDLLLTNPKEAELFQKYLDLDRVDNEIHFENADTYKLLGPMYAYQRGIAEGVADTLYDNIFRQNVAKNPHFAKEITSNANYSPLSLGTSTYINPEGGPIENVLLRDLRKAYTKYTDVTAPAKERVSALRSFSEEYSTQFIDGYLFAAKNNITTKQEQELLALRAFLAKNLDQRDLYNNPYKYADDLYDAMLKIQNMQKEGKGLVQTYLQNPKTAFNKGGKFKIPGFGSGNQGNNSKYTEMYPSADFGLSDKSEQDALRRKAMMLTAADITGLTGTYRVLEQILPGGRNIAEGWDWLAALTLPLLAAKPYAITGRLAAGAGKGVPALDAAFYASGKGRGFLNSKLGKVFGLTLVGSIASQLPDMYNQRLEDVGFYNALINDPNFADEMRKKYGIKKASGGYINPTFTPKMSMPSFDTGVNLLYSDTIAQLHEGEAVIPKEFNPWNPMASAPIGGDMNVNMPLTINAAPGMDEALLANLVSKGVANVMKDVSQQNARIGEPITMNRRYP